MARKKNEQRSIVRHTNNEDRKNANGKPQNVDCEEPSSSSSGSYCLMRNKAKQQQFNRSNRNNADGDDYFDKNDKHFNDFNRQLNRIGLMIRNIKGDGNCLFRALCDQMEGHSRSHSLYRAEIVRYMIENRVDFEPFIEDDVPFDKYMDNLSKNGTYGGQDVLVAFSRMRKVNIVIHQLSSPLWHINSGCGKNCMELHLSYHNGEHYSSVRKFGDESETPANIKLNLTSLDVGQIQKQQSKKPNKSFAYDYSANFIDDDDCCYDNRFDDIDEKIQRVMQISGCQDVTLAQQSLMDFNCNVEDAANYVASLLSLSINDNEQDQDCESSSDNSRAEPSRLDQEESVDPVVALCEPVKMSNTSGQAAGGGAKPKKIMPVKKHTSNKERKDMKRRERMQRQQAKASSKQSNENSMNKNETDEDLLVTSNLGCLNL